METVKINSQQPESAIIKRAAAVILAGGVVIYPTDTAYGLAVDALNEKAIGKLFILKQRVQKPLPVIIDSEKTLKTIAEVTPAEKKLMKKYWPGALTIIFKKKKQIAPFLTLGLPTIGIRIPDNKVCKELVKACGRPLTSTSANISGKGACYTPECVERMFNDSEMQPDLLLDADELPEVPVSTVAQVVDDKIKIIRQGSVKVRL